MTLKIRLCPLCVSLVDSSSSIISAEDFGGGGVGCGGVGASRNRQLTRKETAAVEGWVTAK